MSEEEYVCVGVCNRVRKKRQWNVMNLLFIQGMDEDTRLSSIAS